jgi:bifunctional UDP-N-acetylglucosamine pyrophosphorylase/glucosamine-1-phosphate N-acetyltransferase
MYDLLISGEVQVMSESESRCPRKGTFHAVGIVLAAGMGKRMKTDLPKVAHTILGKPLVFWAMESLIKAGVQNLVVVISPAQEQVKQLLQQYELPAGVRLEIAYQDVALGTAHAAKCGLPAAKRLLAAACEEGKLQQNAKVVVGFGDTPAVTGDSFLRYLNFHEQHQNTFTVLAFESENPTGYGRVISDSAGLFQEIREEKDCSPEQKQVRVCNSGFLSGNFAEFEELLPLVQNDNASKEYYLTDVPKLARAAGKKVGIFSGVEKSELEGVNSQTQLATLAKSMQARIVQFWMEKGVQFLNPEAVYVEEEVTFESGAIVEPFVFLAGRTHISKGMRVRSASRVIDGKPA